MRQPITIPTQHSYKQMCTSKGTGGDGIYPKLRQPDHRYNLSGHSSRDPPEIPLTYESESLRPVHSPPGTSVSTLTIHVTRCISSLHIQQRLHRRLRSLLFHSLSFRPKRLLSYAQESAKPDPINTEQEQAHPSGLFLFLSYQAA